MLIETDDIPPELKEQALQLIREAQRIQGDCEHSFEKRMHYDINYSPRVDGQNPGDEVIKAFRCSKCNLYQSFDEMPFKVCHKCGGKMMSDRQESFGDIRVFVHKCKDCGHEYDTT